MLEIYASRREVLHAVDSTGKKCINRQPATRSRTLSRPAAIETKNCLRTFIFQRDVDVRFKDKKKFVIYFKMFIAIAPVLLCVYCLN